MRRITFKWTYLVLAIVLTAYGGFMLIYNHTHHKEMSILALVFCIIGAAMLVLYFILFAIDVFKKKPVVIKQESEVSETPIEETPVEESKTEEKPVEKKTIPTRDYTYEKRTVVNRSRYDSDSDCSTYYIRKVDYGPVLRVTGNEILDMRTNTYYHIEGNFVNQAGSGPVFEISGNRIRSAFGGYLYEISGDNVNKVYGGFYASFSGNYLTTYNLEEKYEVPSTLNKKQQLLVVALLFGTY